MNRSKIIGSALRTVSDNPQQHHVDGFNTVLYFLWEYQKGKITREALEELWKGDVLNNYDFKLTAREVEKVQGNVLELHGRYMSMQKDRVERILSGMPKLIEFTIGSSAESALVIIDWKVDKNHKTILQQKLAVVLNPALWNSLDNQDWITEAIEILRNYIDLRETDIETRRQSAK